jgi:hypothetical protein
MAFRFSLQPPKTLLELFERIRELLPQLEPRVLENVQVNTTTTTIAHGLPYVPKIPRAPLPNCLAIVCQARPADSTYIYLRASNKCVVNVELTR